MYAGFSMGETNETHETNEFDVERVRRKSTIGMVYQSMNGEEGAAAGILSLRRATST